MLVEPEVPGILWEFCTLEDFPDPWDPPERDARVRSELAEHDLPPWAGVYRTAGPWPTVLRIAPRTGYTIHRGSSCLNCSSWAGGLVVGTGPGHVDVAQVEGARPPPGNERGPGWFHVDERVHFVAWGEFTFAVPEWCMEDFCADAIDGRSFPHLPFRHPDFPAEQRDAFQERIPPRPPGLPDVPAAYRRLLLDQPAECRLVKQVDWRELEDSCEGSACVQRFEAVYSIDASSSMPLAPGLRLWVERDGAVFRGRLEVGDSDSAHIVFSGTQLSSIALRSLAGLRASTRHPRADEPSVAPLGEPR